MSFPFAMQGFIVKSLDELQTFWARNVDDVFPFLVPFQDFNWETSESFRQGAMFIDLPHANNILYYNEYVEGLTQLDCIVCLTSCASVAVAPG